MDKRQAYTDSRQIRLDRKIDDTEPTEPACMQYHSDCYASTRDMIVEGKQKRDTRDGNDRETRPTRVAHESETRPTRDRNETQTSQKRDRAGQRRNRNETETIQTRNRNERKRNRHVTETIQKRRSLLACTPYDYRGLLRLYRIFDDTETTQLACTHSPYVHKGLLRI